MNDFWKNVQEFYKNASKEELDSLFKKYEYLRQCGPKVTDFLKQIKQ